MIICVALDDNNGMLFNNRRQSQDKILRDNLLNESKSSRLWMNEYSMKQFVEQIPENVVVDNDFMDKASIDDYCFVEDVLLANYENKISKLIIYKWNRVYPTDMYLDIDLSNGGWNMESTEEFVGNSHKLITKEVWINEK